MLFLIVKFLVATINDSPCFVKIAIFNHDKCRICLPGKSGIFHVYGAKITKFPVISTKNDFRITDQVVREHFLLEIVQKI